MKYLALAVLLLPAFFSHAEAELCNLPAWPCYEQGMPVPILFEYEGGVEGWDGAIALGDSEGKPCLSIANGCFLILSRGLGDFVPPTNRSEFWQRQTAPRGRLVAPLGDGPWIGEYMVGFTEPFSTLVDIAEHYDISRPGVYTVWWGVRRGREILCESEIMFEILPRGAVARAVEQRVR